MDGYLFKRLAFASASLLALTAAFSIGSLSVRADTNGNTTKYEATHVNDPWSSCTTGSACNVASSWWSGSTAPVNQRYGCTDYAGEPDAAPSWCPAPYNAGWHQGIDISLTTGTTLYSRVAGTVAAAVTSCLLSNCGLGYLAIRTPDNRVVYLLHGSPTSNYTTVGHAVSVGDPVYTTGSNGLSTGPHLHFEVHTSVVGQLSVSVGPGDDVNPEGLLAASTPCTNVTAAASPTSPQPASTRITITGTASGCPNATYEFWAQWAGTTTWQLLQGYSASTSYQWNSTGAAAGTETFAVWVLDTSSTSNGCNTGQGCYDVVDILNLR